jgi:hypothetical protein
MRIVVDLEGVLKGSQDDPIATGVILVAQLAAYNQIALMTAMKGAEAERWINVNKIVDFDALATADMALVDEDLKQRQLKFLRSQGGVGLVITNDPVFWAFAFEQGIPSIMFGVPTYTRPEFRPDAPKRVRAWSEIEAAIAKQNELRTKDKRLTQSEGVRFE